MITKSFSHANFFVTTGAQKKLRFFKSGKETLFMRSFEHIAKLIRTKRVNHPKGYSQSELSNMLGYKNGQFISNVERALCNIPLKMLKRVSEVLDIPSTEIKDAILRDHEQTIENYLRASQEQLDKVSDRESASM